MTQGSLNRLNCMIVRAELKELVHEVHQPGPKLYDFGTTLRDYMPY